MRLDLPSVTPMKRVKSVEVFQNSFGELYNDHTLGASGAPGRYLRWVWAAHGVVVVPVHEQRVGLWAMYRYPIGASSWEFPRGGADSGESVEAAGLRELQEETGLVGRASRLLGSIHPETGLIESSVSVVAVEVESPIPRSRSVESMESIGDSVWLTDDEMRESMRAGLLSCGITIAAWTMHVAMPTTRRRGRPA
jgi:8-oxo-dGTP pyrophosphatase MutT (NUDIX family)